MTNLEKALIGSSLINTLFASYAHGELNSSGELVRKRVAKFMRQRSKSNRPLFLKVIKQTDKAWKQTIDEFAKQHLKIEAKSTIASIYNYIAEDMSHFVKISDDHMEMFMIQAVDDAEAERNSTIVVDYLMNEIGLKKSKSLFSGKKLIIKNNLILDSVKIAEGF